MMDTRKLRQKILDLAIRGRLAPQDPADEPAALLLHRINPRAATIEENPPFEVPNSWVWIDLKSICSKFSTGPFGSMVHKADYVSSGIPLVNPINIVSDGISGKKLMYVSSEKAKELEKYTLAVGDIVIARRGDLSKCAIVKADNQGWLCGTGSFFLRLKEILPQYFQFIYASTYVQTILRTDCIGATMDNLNQNVLGRIPIPLPPLPEQERIVKAVERWMKLADEIEAAKGDLAQTTARAKAKVLDLAIRGRLVPQDPTDEPAAQLLQRINPQAETITENPLLGDIPESWCWCRIGDVSASALGKTLDRKKDKGETKPYLCSINVFNGRIDLTTVKEFRILPNEMERYAVRPNDLLVCEGGDVGRCALWLDDCEMYYQNAIHRIRFKGGISPDYFMYVFHTLKDKGLIDGASKGVTIKHFTQTAMQSLAFPLPPLPEQSRIVAAIERHFAQLDTIAAAL